MDRNHSTIRSFTEYEEDLKANIIPVIHNNFEELDEDSTNVLFDFFKWNGVAVRHATAQSTRKVVKSGIVKSSEFGMIDNNLEIKDDETLHHFALNHVLNHRMVNQVSVGIPKVEQVDDLLPSFIE